MERGNSDPEEFSEDFYVAEYKVIISQLRTFSRHSILNHARNFVYTDFKNNDSIEIAKRMPWVAFQAIKWVYLDDFQYPEDSDKGTDFFLVILNKIWNLSNYGRMPSDFDNPSFFMRALAFQQFPYQRKLNVESVGRLLCLFEDGNNHFYDDFLLRVVGLDVEAFLRMAMAVALFLLRDPSGVISVSNKHQEENELKLFLDSCSVELVSLSEKLKEATEGMSLPGCSEEYLDVTPFVAFPFIRANYQSDTVCYVCMHVNIFFRWLESSIYDLLKRADSVKFMNKFGRKFEEYITNLIKIYDYDFYSEDQIRGMIGKDKMVVDFLIRENDADLYIDAKAVEMIYRGRVVYQAGTLRSVTKSHALKAVSQANSTRQSFAYLESEIKEAFAIVVTFKELYLGSGYHFFENVAKYDAEKMNAQFGHHQIPPENIFFLTIEDLELLLHNVKIQNITLGSFLRKAKEADSPLNSSLNKFNFKLHLQNAGFFEFPPMLKKRYEDFVDFMEKDYN